VREQLKVEAEGQKSLNAQLVVALEKRGPDQNSRAAIGKKFEATFFCFSKESPGMLSVGGWEKRKKKKVTKLSFVEKSQCAGERKHCFARKTSD